MPSKDEIEAHIAWLEHKDCCNASHSMGVDGLSEKGCNCDQSATLLRALAEDNEDMIKNINLKADFIDATLHQLRTEEERAEAAEAQNAAKDKRIAELEVGLREIAETPNAGWMIARALLEKTK